VGLILFFFSTTPRNFANKKKYRSQLVIGLYFLFEVFVRLIFKNSSANTFS